jgi:uncharacterized protein YjdB
MEIPTPNKPVKGAGTNLWLYMGAGDPYANPQSDIDWIRLAKIKELTPGELTAESYDDTYLDDENADWARTGQGQKSAGNGSFTLAWMPGESGQQALVSWFTDGDVKAYKIRYPNGTLDVFSGWPSSLGKVVPIGETVTRTAQITNVGKPSLAENSIPITPVTDITATPVSATVAVGATVTVQLSILPLGATDKSFLVTSADPSIATVTASELTLTITGVDDGEVNIVVITSDGKKVVIIPVIVS